MVGNGLKASITHFPPAIPVMHWMPPYLRHFSESAMVTTPTSSSTLSKPSGYRWATISAMEPVSMTTSWAPWLRRRSSRSGFRVVATTKAPCAFASAVAARPIVVLPPRIRRRSFVRSLRGPNKLPHAVCMVSGRAPSLSQDRLVLMPFTCAALTHVYSA